MSTIFQTLSCSHSRHRLCCFSDFPPRTLAAKPKFKLRPSFLFVPACSSLSDDSSAFLSEPCGRTDLRHRVGLKTFSMHCNRIVTAITITMQVNSNDHCLGFIRLTWILRKLKNSFPTASALFDWTSLSIKSWSDSTKENKIYVGLSYWSKIVAHLKQLKKRSSQSQCDFVEGLEENTVSKEFMN